MSKETSKEVGDVRAEIAQSGIILPKWTASGIDIMLQSNLTHEDVAEDLNDWEDRLIASAYAAAQAKKAE